MHFKKTKLKKEAAELRKKLARTLDWEDYNNVLERSEHNAENTFKNTKKRYIEKFLRMQGKEMHKLQQQGIDQHKWIVNLYFRILTNTEERNLQGGLNFATTLRKIPYMDVFAAVGWARRLNNEEGNDLRGSVCSLLKDKVSPKQSCMEYVQCTLENTDLTNL